MKWFKARKKPIEVFVREVEPIADIKCERWCSDFCFDLCAYRSFGCAYEHKYPRKVKAENEPEG